MIAIKISDLRHRLELEEPQLTPDAGGGAAINWVKVADLWGFIEPLSGRESFIEHQTETVLTHKIIIRFRHGVLPEMRLRHGTRVFEIISVMNEKERNVWLQLECKEQRL